MPPSGAESPAPGQALPLSPLSPLSPEPPPLRLEIPYDMAALEPARLAALRHVEGHKLSARAVYRLELVLEEALMNRLWHAMPEGSPARLAGLIRVSLRVLPDTLELCVEDDGVPFDPTQAPEAPVPATLEQARPGGLGLMLTRKAVHTMHHERRDGRNRLTLQIARD